MPAELTNFLQEYFEDRLNYELNQLGMGFYTKKEKTFKDFRFDMYAYSRKARTFLIWELEINNNLESCINNVKKIRKVLNLKWKPYVHMFHIFSPFCKSYKNICQKEANKQKKKSPLRFNYIQFDIKIPLGEFDEIYTNFKRNRRLAEKKHGKRLKIHIGRIIGKSLMMFEGK